ncbi:hypothetical protein AC249_AIPGENE5956 [Exaiptasia diaphana]|nr:hypothetical protein AC249_AIPGENE5956 [Exaiptasia diaphana]
MTHFYQPISARQFHCKDCFGELHSVPECYQKICHKFKGRICFFHPSVYRMASDASAVVSHKRDVNL